MRYCILIVLFFLSAEARENPFKPLKEFEEGKQKATNIIRQYDDFEEKEFVLPNNARVLKYLKVGYQALDGSIKERKIKIDKTIDWHENLVLTKESSLLPPVPQMALETALKTKPNVKADKKEVKKEVKPIVAQKRNPPPTSEKKSFSFRNLLNFTVEDKQLTIETDNTLIRDFMVVSPYKLVFDFKKTNSFYTKTMPINLAPFKNVTFGSHGSFYRASFLLDGPYRYTIHKKRGFIEIHLH